MHAACTAKAVLPAVQCTAPAGACLTHWQAASPQPGTGTFDPLVLQACDSKVAQLEQALRGAEVRAVCLAGRAQPASQQP